MPKKTTTTHNQSAVAGDAMASNGNAARKPTRTRKKSTPPKPSPAATKQPQVSDEQIRIRAYFIAEQRSRQAIPGDAHSDWLEARRQLLAELGES